MPELIDRQAVLAEIGEFQIRFNETGDSHERVAYASAEHCKLVIKAAPTIKAEPVRHGRWVETEPDEDDRKIGIEFSIKCSICHDENSHLDFNENHEITGKTFWKSRFCPNCGAYMREGGGADNGD